MNASIDSFPTITVGLLLVCSFTRLPAEGAQTLTLETRSRVRSATDSNQWQIVEKSVQCEPKKTALVICDMWDKHWCAGATRRVAEMAPRMNQVIQKARQQGVFIVHCPSDTMKFYEGTPARKLALSAPAVSPKVPLQRWCSLDQSKEAPLPIDDSDGGCDDSPPCKHPPYPWSHQIDTIEIREGDAITDSAEAYYLMQQRGIENVIVMGVHLNMCVLGRPFSIRQMVNQGKNVLLVRDMTDTMYNSRKSPFVPHCVGTELMIEHVEKYWCPSVSSVAFLGGHDFRFTEDKRPQAVFLIGEDEYKTWETLPLFAKKDLTWRGVQVSLVQQSSADKNQFPGLIDALRDADVLLVSVRRRALPAEQINAIRAHLEAGKALVAIRTASHAFAPRGKDAEAGASWETFDPEVLGGNYAGHHGAGARTAIAPAPGAENHSILTGIDLSQLVGHGSLYKVSPLSSSATPLLIGSIPQQPAQPVAWTHRFGKNKARVFYTSLGHPDDFRESMFRRLLLNAILWSVEQPIPPVEAKLAADTRPTKPSSYASAAAARLR
jgi:nicotinamidase-related amidase/type 1 glutamine amidotransferase